MNTLQCKDCVYFDEQYKNVISAGANKKPRTVRLSLEYGWCAATSTYPAQEQDGQVFHPEAKRRDPSERRLANSVIVDKNGVQSTCTSAIKK